MGPEGLILVSTMGAIALTAAGTAVVMARRSWGVLVGAEEGPLAGFPSEPTPIDRPAAAQYAGWGREKRVAHWVQSLERSARDANRAGRTADTVFNPGLVDQMRRTDPHIELLLPVVLADLAENQAVEPDLLCTVFARGTGMPVEVPQALVEERRQARLERAQR